MLENNKEPNLYQILGVNHEATIEAIKAGWKLAARKNHPDKFDYEKLEERKAAEERMRSVTLAWATLSDPDKRRLYDLHIGIREARCSSCGQMGKLRLGANNQVVGLCDNCYSPRVTIL